VNTKINRNCISVCFYFFYNWRSRDGFQASFL